MNDNAYLFIYFLLQGRSHFIVEDIMFCVFLSEVVVCLFVGVSFRVLPTLNLYLMFISRLSTYLWPSITFLFKTNYVFSLNIFLLVLVVSRSETV